MGGLRDAPFGALLLLGAAASVALGDPETVDGMYLTKKSEVVAKNSRSAAAVPHWQTSPPPAAAVTTPSVPSFQQGYMSKVFKAKEGRAFGQFLATAGLQTPQQQAKVMPTFSWYPQPVQAAVQQPPVPPQPMFYQGLQQYNMANGIKNRQYPTKAQQGHIRHQPLSAVSSAPMRSQPQPPRAAAIVGREQQKQKLLKPSSLERQTQQEVSRVNQIKAAKVAAAKAVAAAAAAAAKTTTTTTTTQPNIDLNQVGRTEPPPPANLNQAAATITVQKKTKEEVKKSSESMTSSTDGAASNISPRAGFLKGHRTTGENLGTATDSVGAFTGQDRQKAILGLIIGVAFVAVFVSIGIGLATQCVMERVRARRSASGVFGHARTPNEEDRTPPELRTSGHPTFVQPPAGAGSGDADSMKGSLKGGKASPYFTGKLILQDPPGLCRPKTNNAGAANGSNSSRTGSTASANSACILTGGETSMTTTLLATQAACMMPSPAEQVTDSLVSPKYDDEETTEDDEDDDSDDTVYECPGLAAPGEMVVSNPFFLQGGEMPHLEAAAASGSEPQPISRGSIFHHGIKGVN